MTQATILPRDSELFRRLHQAAAERRCVFFAGLPGVGKSLLLQQLSLVAGEIGRRVHLLQWDVARGPFETPAILERYPEVDGVTHAVIRKAVGVWARGAVAAWNQRHPDRHDLLIGEAPLIGNRLIELVQRRADTAEALLAGEATLFLIPVPSREVRQVIEAARAREMASPIHERERANAIPSLVQVLWEEIVSVADALGVRPPSAPQPPPLQAGVEEQAPDHRPPKGSRRSTSRPLQAGVEEPAPDHRPSPLSTAGARGRGQVQAGFDPELYASVYAHLLRHRHAARLDVTAVSPVRGSVYDALALMDELVPTAEEVDRIVAAVSARPEAEIARDVDGWFNV